MKISVIAPVLNEVEWIGFSVMAAEPYVEEFVYAVDEKSSDGTRELLRHIKDKHLHERLVVLHQSTYHPHNREAYNESFNRCIRESKGDACIFLHPDMIVTKGPSAPLPHALAWYSTIKSFAGDRETVITKGRADKWKNIHAKKFGLHYFGGYGSQNEDFYHSDITGKSYKHYGTEFLKYPYQVADSGIRLNHYCENKSYARRLEKMKLCLKTMYPTFPDERIDELAAQHPRVTLEASSTTFGVFAFETSQEPIPEVFEKYKEFREFKKEESWQPQSPSTASPQTGPISIQR